MSLKSSNTKVVQFTGDDLLKAAKEAHALGYEAGKQDGAKLAADTAIRDARKWAAELIAPRCSLDEIHIWSEQLARWLISKPDAPKPDVPA